MSLQSSLRLLRRPQVYITFMCFLVFLLALANFNSRVILGLLPSVQKSPCYTEDGSHYYSWKTPSYFPPLKNTQKGTPVDLCKNFPTHVLDEVRIVMKTGAGESAKSKAHLDTVSSCITNILVFSDLEEMIGSHQSIDSLADLPHRTTTMAILRPTRRRNKHILKENLSGTRPKAGNSINSNFSPWLIRHTRCARVPIGTYSSKLMCTTSGVCRSSLITIFFKHVSDQLKGLTTAFRSVKTRRHRFLRPEIITNNK